MKLAVIGSFEFNLGFRLVGIRDIYDVENSEQVVKAVLDVLKRKDIGVVVVEHKFMEEMPISLKREIEEQTEKAFVPVGGEEVKELRDKIRRALGVDLWKLRK